MRLWYIIFYFEIDASFTNKEKYFVQSAPNVGAAIAQSV
jgi:hypothetical protein